MSDNEREIDKPEAEIENPGSFAVRLFHARGAHPPVGLTQAQLAERAGLQQSTIAHYEAGRREPSLSNLRRLVRATGQSADYLLATRPGVDADYGALARPERQRRIDATESALRDLGVGPARSLRCAEIAEEDGGADPDVWHRARVGLVRDLGPDGFCALESPCAVESFRLMLRDAAAALQRHVAQASSTDVRAALLRSLAEGMKAALAGGDVEAARIAHETIGRLLPAPGPSGGVIDLAAERARRDL